MILIPLVAVAIGALIGTLLAMVVGRDKRKAVWTGHAKEWEMRAERYLDRGDKAGAARCYETADRCWRNVP